MTRTATGQAEIVFADAFVEYLERLADADREAVLEEVLRLCDTPLGDHSLGNRGTRRLAGWNTIAVLGREHRVVFASRRARGTTVIEVLCAGPRRADAVYDMAAALIGTGRLAPDEVTGIWQALVLLDLVAERLGLDGWDYRPSPADQGLVRSAVASGLLPAELAGLLSREEIVAAMEAGWEGGEPDPAAALHAALQRSRADAVPGDATRIVARRAADRCDAVMPRAGRRCVRIAGHPGPHRSTP